MPSNPNIAFTLLVRLGRGWGTVKIDAFDGHNPNHLTETGGWVSGWDAAGRIRLTVEVKHSGKVIFPAGQLTCAVHGSSDGIAARELVMSLVAMKPGDTDRDYFDGYTPEQLAWCEAYGEALSMERERRYCDEDGNVRKPARITGPSDTTAWQTER